MPRTLDEIIAAKGAQTQAEAPAAPRSVEEILADARKQQYPDDVYSSAERPTGFVKTGPHSMAYYGAGGEPLGPPMPNDPLGELSTALKTTAEFGIPLALSEFGGGLVPNALVKARPIIGGMVKAGARALGFGAGSEATAPLEGEMPSVRRGLRTARNVALFEGAVRTPAYLLGRAGSVEPAAAALAADNPALLKPVPAREFAQAATDIAKTQVQVPQTAEHFGYNMLLRARGEIPTAPYIRKMTEALRRNVHEGAAANVERKTAKLAKDFADAFPTGKAPAEAIDEWIRTNLSEPAARVYEKGANVVPGWPERLQKLNNDLTPQLYRDIGGGAAELQARASERLAAAEPKFFSKKTIESPGALRQILKNNDLGEEVRTRLRGLDELAGTNHYARVEELAMRDSWTGAEKAEVEDILANVPALGRERVGMVRAGARAMGRGLSRAARPVGRIAGVGQVIRRKPSEEK